MKSKYLIPLALLAGIICGVLSTHAFMIGFFNLAFWGVVGIGIGLLSGDKKTTNGSGIVYGFFLSISFLFSGFQGTPDKLPTFVLFSLFLSVIGAVCGWALARIGGWTRRKI
jgi:uncharacterized membrane protein AbrB (regulator of aidB expression)